MQSTMAECVRLHRLVVIVDGDVHIHLVVDARRVRVGQTRRYYCCFSL